MKRFSSFLATLAAFVFCVGQAQAALIGTVTHDYGSGGYAPSSLGAGTCDALNTSSVTVRNASGCQRFYDAFDFSHLGYDSIDSFSLSVTFSDTANSGGNFFAKLLNNEQWRVRPASSPVNGSDLNNSYVNMDRSAGLTTNSYSFNASMDVFGDILSGETFYLWFNHSGAGKQEFNLYSASLEVYGAPSAVATVPTPGILGLFGVGLMGIALRRRKSV